MSNFLNLLPMDLSRVTDFIEPMEDVDEEDGDEVIGEMSDEQRRMFTKGQQLLRECLDYCGSDMIPHMSQLMTLTGKEDPRKEEFLGQAEESFSLGSEMKAKMQVILELLDIVVKDEYHVWGPNWDVGYRKGFKIVKFRVM